MCLTKASVRLRLSVLPLTTLLTRRSMARELDTVDGSTRSD